jgi:phytanoyl-CoA dioxygenase PhyH
MHAESDAVNAKIALGTLIPGPRQLAQFERDGFVVLPGYFSDAEIAPLRDACHSDPSIGGRLRAVADSSGKAQEIIEWTTFSDDYVGVVPRLARLIDGAEALLGKPVYHWHSKLSMKAPHSEGRWDWHQDYPYWYDEGCLSPDMLTCMIAVDPATRANGCVNLIPGSHRYGRIDHVPIGASSGCDPQRLELIQRRSPPVPVEMNSGDACFFHCNTLHASSGNSTDFPRTLLHCTYNAIDNSPFIEEGQEHHRYRPFDKIADSALLEHRWKGIFENHVFNCFGDAGAVNRYGYQVIARA